MIDSQDLDKLWTDDESELKKMLLDMGVDLDQLEKDFENYHPRKPLKYEVMSDDAIEPSYNYPSDSGFDLYSTEEIVLTPFGRALVPTGLKFDIPDGSEIQVRPKSGLAIKQGITVLNTPGTVDSGYNGEIQVIVFNTNPEPFTIQKGMKIAQAVLCPVVNGNWVELIKVDSIEDKDRGDNGFGSTGLGVEI
jgi:dUTP pyrophosphatase